MSEHLITDMLIPEQYSGKYIGSFAYLTIKDRLPVILVKVVDFLCQNKNSIAELHGEDAREEVKEIIGRLSALQNEMVTNKNIKPLVDGGLDVAVWNEYLKEKEEIYGFIPTWFDSSWLYSECYFYRRIKQAFQLSHSLKDFDPFHKQKEDSFIFAIEAASFLCTALNETIEELGNSNGKTDMFQLFRRFVEVSMWSNKWDLSMTSGVVTDEHSSPLNQLEELRKNIIANDSETLWQILQDSNVSSKDVLIDVVLDNAGFELCCDLCLLCFLQAAKLVKKVRIYAKVMPWFISDTLEKDIHWLLDTLSKSNYKNLVKFSEECNNKLTAGEWEIVNEPFWTYPHDFSEMQRADPLLYKKLGESDLIIFKGDLNYRKLAGDRQWDETTSFKEALNGFLPSTVVTFRTVKSNVVVGLQPGTSEELDKISENWKFKGDYAVLQCCRKSNNLS